MVGPSAVRSIEGKAELEVWNNWKKYNIGLVVFSDACHSRGLTYPGRLDLAWTLE